MKKLAGIIILSIAGIVALHAKPAYRGPLNYVQPDGSEITVYQHGDEYFHWTTNASGEWIAKDSQGKYVPVPALTEEQISARRKSSRRNAPAAMQQATPINLAPRGLVVLVNFTDVQFRAENNLTVMRDMHNGDHYSHSYTYTDRGTAYSVKAEGSARQYFIEQSCGQYQPHFDVVGPFTLSHEMKYYGENDAQGNDKRAEEMIKEACQLADESGVDFSIYDNNNDGNVDFVYVIYAGFAEADGGGDNTIWPHSFHLTYAYINLYVDDKKVDLYACGSEMNYVSQQRAGISTFCHEFGHVMGLPDIYATVSNATWKTSGAWDIMDYGPYNNDGNTPPAYSGYERLFFGWATPRVLNSAADVTIKELQEYNDVCVITKTGVFNGKGNDPNPNLFYVLENRQLKGWDKYLPGHGMMLTRINYSYSKWANNTPNNSKGSLCIDIIEADGKTPSYNAYYDNGYYGKEGDLFPAGATEYTEVSEYPVTEISESNGEVYLKVKGGGAESHIDIIQPTNITLSQTEVQLNSDKLTETLYATVSPDGITFPAVIWTSSNNNIASVHDGVVTAISGGSAVITATIHSSGLSASANVTCDLPNGIEGVHGSANEAGKVIENGQVYIIRDGAKYTILGERVE